MHIRLAFVSEQLSSKLSVLPAFTGRVEIFRDSYQIKAVLSALPYDYEKFMVIIAKQNALALDERMNYGILFLQEDRLDKNDLRTKLSRLDKAWKAAGNALDEELRISFAHRTAAQLATLKFRLRIKLLMRSEEEEPEIDDFSLLDEILREMAKDEN